MTNKEYIDLGLNGSAPLKVILCGKTEYVDNKVYGGDAIAELLKTYDALREKKTDALINRLIANGKSYLADVIKKHLIQTDGSYKEG